jgi:hypothetical protein
LKTLKAANVRDYPRTRRSRIFGRESDLLAWLPEFDAEHWYKRGRNGG